jgi:hypothetical protein
LRHRIELLIAVLFCATATRNIAAQSAGAIIDSLSLDKLQIVSLGVGAGRIAPSQVNPTNIVAVSADYGQIVPSWHIGVNGSFWKSAYRASVVQEFVDSLNRNFSGGGANHVVASRVSVYDVTFGADARYIPVYSGELKPFLGLGIAAHVINAEGPLINGTFVERALDDIAVGAYVTTGVSFKIVKNLGIEGSARGDLLSGFRSLQARVGATYYFGGVHVARPTG